MHRDHHYYIKAFRLRGPVAFVQMRWKLFALHLEHGTKVAGQKELNGTDASIQQEVQCVQGRWHLCYMETDYTWKPHFLIFNQLETLQP